jgi:cysteine desulfurase/selenocysteine lyase
MDEEYFKSYRREFPITKDHIYLDHAGIAPVSLRAVHAIQTFLRESSEEGAFHYPAWTQRVLEIRRACAGLINAEIDEIAFIKNTSHGLSLVANGLDWKPGDNVLVYEREFPANIHPWLNLRQFGVTVKLIPARDGGMELHDIEQLMDSKTRLLSISSVQFASGFRLDLKRVGDLCRRNKILLCVDAIQSLGVIPMDVAAFQIDFLAADAHKWLLGPEGIGIFYCRRGLAERLVPPLIGWRSVQNEFDFDHPDFRLKPDALRFEEGSMNLMGVMGLGAAVELLVEVGIGNIEDRVLGLGDTIIREAERRGFSVLTPRQKRERGGGITVAGNFDPAATRDRLREKGIMVNVRGGGLRLSPHFYNTHDELLTVFSSF